MMPRLTASPKPMSSSANKAPAARKAAYIAARRPARTSSPPPLPARARDVKGRVLRRTAMERGREAITRLRAWAPTTTTEAVGKKLQMALCGGSWDCAGSAIRRGARGVGRGAARRGRRAGASPCLHQARGRDARESLCREVRCDLSSCRRCSALTAASWAPCRPSGTGTLGRRCGTPKVSENGRSSAPAYVADRGYRSRGGVTFAPASSVGGGYSEVPYTDSELMDVAASELRALYAGQSESGAVAGRRGADNAARRPRGASACARSRGGVLPRLAAGVLHLGAGLAARWRSSSRRRSRRAWRRSRCSST